MLLHVHVGKCVTDLSLNINFITEHGIYLFIIIIIIIQIAKYNLHYPHILNM